MHGIRFASISPAALILLTVPVHAQPKVTAADPRFAYWGRWDLRKPAEKGAITVNTGSTILFNFSGTGGTLRFDTDHYPADLPTLWLQVDDHSWRVVRPAKRLPISAKPLGAGKHQVRVVVKGFREWDRRWESPLESSIVFRGLTLDDGADLDKPPARPKHTIEYLGDSITEGVLTHYDKQQPMRRNRWPDYSDGRQGWAYQSARRIGAEPRVVGFGRLGLTIGGNGGVPTAMHSYRNIYSGVPIDRTRDPDIVVINLGTNDGGTGAEIFGPLYDEYLQRIRRLYPQARLLAMRPFNGAHGKVIQRVVADRIKAGDDRLMFVDTTGWIQADVHTSDSVHLNLAGHQRVTEKIAPILKRVLGN